MSTASSFLSSVAIVLIGCLPGFLVGLWVARNESRGRRLLVAALVGVALFLTPIVVGVVAQYT